MLQHQQYQLSNQQHIICYKCLIILNGLDCLLCPGYHLSSFLLKLLAFQLYNFSLCSQKLPSFLCLGFNSVFLLILRSQPGHASWTYFRHILDPYFKIPIFWLGDMVWLKIMDFLPRSWPIWCQDKHIYDNFLCWSVCGWWLSPIKFRRFEKEMELPTKSPKIKHQRNLLHSNKFLCLDFWGRKGGWH